MAKLLSRAEIPVEQTWNLEDLFRSADEWEAAFTAVEAALPDLAQYKGRLGEGAATVKGAIETLERVQEKFMHVAAYANLNLSGDGTNPAYQAMMGRVGGLGARFSATVAYFRPELLQLPDAVLQSYLADQSLAVYRKMLQDIVDVKPHTLSPETEAALASLGEVLSAPSMVYNRSKSSDMTFEPFTTPDGTEHPMSFNLYENQYDEEADPALRRGAWESFGKGLKRYVNTYAATFATEIKKNVALAKLRGYSSATHMQLQPHEIPIECYENLLNIIQSELAPHMRRYARLRKKVLGLDKVMYCDLRAPLDPEYNPKISFAEASDLILESLQIMGPEYNKLMRNALKERWCDIADNVGKSSGAFCSSIYGVHPFILVTWKETMRGAFILTHELGHAGHFGLAMQYQRIVNMRPSTYFTEAPSTLNEIILGNHILSKTDDPRMKRWVTMQFLGTFHHNYITHMLEAELQRRLYTHAEAGKPVTAQTLSQFKGQILQDFWGDTVEIDETAKLTWMRQPHYYMGLYPYTYSAGLTTAVAVGELIRTEGQPAVDRWLECLKAGGTMKPLDLMRKAGVDMSKPDPIRNAVAYVGRLVDDLEASFG